MYNKKTMCRTTIVLLSALFSLLPAAPARAQEGGGPLGPFDDRAGFYRTRKIAWQSSIESALNTTERSNEDPSGTVKRYIFVYVYPPGGDKEPNIFNNNDLTAASYEDWIFVKFEFEKENPALRILGVRSAPACLGCDIFSNAFAQTSVVAIGTVRGLVKSTPDLIARYEQKLKIDFNRATTLAQTDPSRAARLFAGIVADGKPGYKEFMESLARLEELTVPVFNAGEMAESVSVEAGIAFYEERAKTYANTPPGARAEIRLALLEHLADHIQTGLQRLLKIQKLDPRIFKNEISAADRAIETISQAGEEKIQAIEAKADRNAAKEGLRKLARDYAGTAAGRHAAEAARKYE